MLCAGSGTPQAFLAEEFFDARDMVQVKYEMVRRVWRHLVKTGYPRL